jgi:hypothetical protein
MNQKSNITKYTTLCGVMNRDGARKSKKNYLIYLLTKYIKSILRRVAVCLPYM